MSDDKIARLKLNDERVPIQVPICGEVGSIRTSSTVEGDTTIHEVRTGINASGAACLTAVGAGATVGVTELLVATEGATALAVAGEAVLLGTATSE